MTLRKVKEIYSDEDDSDFDDDDDRPNDDPDMAQMDSDGDVTDSVEKVGLSYDADDMDVANEDEVLRYRVASRHRQIDHAGSNRRTPTEREREESLRGVF